MKREKEVSNVILSHILFSNVSFQYTLKNGNESQRRYNDANQLKWMRETTWAHRIESYGIEFDARLSMQF